MNCQRVEQLLSDGLEGRLSEAAGATVAAHMTQCPACRQFRDEYATLGADLRALLDLTPPDGAEQQAVRPVALGRSRSAALVHRPVGARALPSGFAVSPGV